MKLLIGSAIAGAVVGLGAAWYLRGPGPLDFTGGKTVALADYKEDDPTGVPAAMRQVDMLERGKYLAEAADCVVCHTAPGGKAFAGGFPFKLPFGTMYSTNITPDPETGIGKYTDQQFIDAMHRGIRRDGQRLYPAMPYTSYSYVTDADALAIKAYLFSLAPVRVTPPENALLFPFNQRWVMMFWSLIFNRDTRFEPDTSQSAKWNRGAYLAEALAHCGECHTPRNIGFALDNRQKFGGAPVDGWRAFNISSDKATGLGGWSDQDIAFYLSAGHASGHGTASGPMGEAVDHSFST
ncbi:c-type cytochrome, partial [Bradyrhizobium sp.]|uniref:c-type cytochrome n=1 Tax=Bradyrhizobium sp. TaxID=376 RepID=UPI003C61A710